LLIPQAYVVSSRVGGWISEHVPIEWLVCECTMLFSEYGVPGQCVPGREGLAFEMPIRGLWCDVARKVGASSSFRG